MALIYAVEDDAGVLELILCALKTGGFDGVGFVNGDEMLKRLAEIKPSLILLDVMLPGKSGIDIINILKNSADRDIPVIFLTAKTGEIDRVVGLDIGADDYILKPFGVMELLSRIKAVLRRTQKNEPVLSAGNVVLDNEAHEVRSNGHELALTHKEFELLRVLFKNSGKVLARERLLNDVWGYNYYGETRTLDVHIRTLRAKLAETGSSAVISTVRNIGYKLQVNGNADKP
jgi:two-component system alkaline phosphatase synthesis response regulator PhoP